MLALISNASSSANVRDPRRSSRFAKIIGSRGQVTVTRSPEELAPICARLEATRPAIVAICGGDGTLHHTLTALIRAYRGAPLPYIAILRGGAMNIVADSLGIRGGEASMVRALGEAADHGTAAKLEVFHHDLLQVGDRFGFMFGIGVVHDFLQRYYALDRPSPATALGLLLRGIASGVVGGPMASGVCRPFQVNVTADGIIWPRRRYVMLCAATIEQIGLGFRPFYRCRERGGGFAVLGVDTTPLGLVRELPRVRAGKPMRSDKVLIDHLAREVAITPISPAALGYMIDGDLYTTERPLTIKVGPAVTFLRLSR